MFYLVWISSFLLQQELFPLPCVLFTMQRALVDFVNLWFCQSSPRSSICLILVCPVNSANPAICCQFYQLVSTLPITGTKIADWKEVNILKWIRGWPWERDVLHKRRNLWSGCVGVWSRDQEKCNSRVATCKVIKIKHSFAIVTKISQN